MSNKINYLPVRYWLQDESEAFKNYGDYLSEFFLNRVLIAPKCNADVFHLIGSVITEAQIRSDFEQLGVDEDSGTVAFWGCGLRSESPLSAWARKRALFFGVRGPKTRDALNLPISTPIGDPALILPLVYTPPRVSDGDSKKAICVVHYLDPRNDEEILEETGVDRVLRASIAANEGALKGMIDSIANASFVLCGALHAAITACAYKVPFAYYDSGYVDVPFKWEDFASAIGVPTCFTKNLEDGKDIFFQRIVSSYKPIALFPILAVAPFSVRLPLFFKALWYDGKIGAEQLAELLADSERYDLDGREGVDFSQRLWLSRVKEMSELREGWRQEKQAATDLANSLVATTARLEEAQTLLINERAAVETREREFGERELRLITEIDGLRERLVDTVNQLNLVRSSESTLQADLVNQKLLALPMIVESARVQRGFSWRVACGIRKLKGFFCREKKMEGGGDFSSELSDIEFVEAAYRLLLGRLPDREGLQHHLNHLKNGHRRVAVFTAMAASKEAAQRSIKMKGLDMHML